MSAYVGWTSYAYVWWTAAAIVAVPLAAFFLRRTVDRRRRSRALFNFIDPNRLHEPDTARTFAEKMLSERFAVLALSDEQAAVVRQLRDAADRFFAMPADEKNRSVAPPRFANGEIAELTAVKDNKGFIFVDTIKEYLKITGDDGNFPSADYERAHRAAYALFARMASDCLRAMAQYKIDGRSMWQPAVLESVLKFAPARSAVSVIHYFAREPESARSSYGDTAIEFFPSPPHVDTGVLTLIVCADVPGLQIADATTGEYIRAEEIMGASGAAYGTRVFVIQGRKASIFSDHALASESGRQYTATLHRVALPARCERTSLLFYMDTPA